ncbi:coiled-coil domain-containing protein [Vibrio tetraodonis]|uniref:coiled-coil domain-containing protein n=1 Tax=Vibrio tetraodonis TaxID=2231647 RepID=UPI000E0B6CFE|nr:hypothetical protein [Vibrio tetraodonis]
MLRKTAVALSIAMVSSSALAVPSVFKCKDSVGLADNIFFNEACTEAYVGFPPFGEATVDNFSKTNESLCDAYDSAMDSYVDTQKTYEYLIAQSNALAKQTLSITQSMDDKRVELNVLKADLEVADTKILDLSEEQAVADQKYVDARDTLLECKAIAIDYRADCADEITEFTSAARERRAIKSDVAAAKTEQRAINRKMVVLQSTLDTLKSNYDNALAQLLNIKSSVAAAMETSFDLLDKYAKTYGGNATLLFETKYAEYVRQKKQELEGKYDNMTWRDIRPREAGIGFIVPSDEIEKRQLTALLSPVIVVGTPDFPVFEASQSDYNTDTGTPREPVPIAKATYSDNEFDNLSKPFPDSFPSTVTLSLHGSCPVSQAEKKQLLTHVAPYVSVSYELKGKVSYEAVVNREAVISFVEKTTSIGFVGFSYVKDKIRAEQDIDVYVSIKFTSSTYEGTLEQQQVKRTLQENLLERATIAVLDTIAVRKTVDPASAGLLNGTETPSEQPKPPVQVQSNLEQNTGVSTALCSTADAYTCAAGWVIDNTSIGVKITDYKQKISHRYEETVTEDFYIPMNKTFGFKAK